MLADCTALIAALPRLVLLDDLACSYYPLLRSRWQLCCLTDVAYPLRVIGCGVHGFAMNLLRFVTTRNRALLP